MAQFKCRVIGANGQVMEEVFTADSKTDLVNSLRGRGFRPVSVEEVKKGIGAMELGGNKIKFQSIILFCRQMSTLLNSGVPLIKCFDIVASQSDDKVLKRCMAQLSAEVQAGAVLSGAMEKQGTMFPKMLIKMIEVGEVTGELAGIMDRMANQYEADNRIVKKVKGALVYPMAMLVIAIGAAVFMMIVIVPQFAEMFASLDSELPLPTKILMDTSTFITKRWYVLVLIIPMVILGVKQIISQPSVKYYIDGKKLSLPMLRGPMQKVVCAQMARTLHTLISSGVPIVQAFEYTNRNIKNLVVNEAINKIIVGLQQGKGISSQMAEFPIFPKLLVSMLSIGEASGNLEDMLSKTADYYDEELDAAISQLMTLLEPIMMLLVGGIIGGIVMALYAPMFGMITAMQDGI